MSCEKLDQDEYEQSVGDRPMTATITATRVRDFKSPGMPYGAPTREPVTALAKKVVGMEVSGGGPCVEGFRLSLADVDVIVIGDTYNTRGNGKRYFCLYWRRKFGSGPSEWTCSLSSFEFDGTPLDWVRRYPHLLPLFGPEVWLEIPLEDVVAWGEPASVPGCGFDTPAEGGPLAIECRATNKAKGTARFYVYRRETGHDVTYFHVVEGDLYFGIDHDAWRALSECLPDSAKIIFTPTATPKPLRVGAIRSSPIGIRVKAGVKIAEYHP